MNLKTLLFSILFIGISQLLSASPRRLLVTKKTTLRTESNASSPKIVRLAVNDTLLFLNNCTNYFCKVSFNGQIGWAKKRCFREIYPAVIQSKKVSPKISSPIRTEEIDSTAWEGLPIIAVLKDTIVGKESPLEDAYQRLREVKSVEAKMFLVKDYGEEIEADMEELERREEEDADYSEGEKNQKFIQLILIGIFVFFCYNAVVKTSLFKKQVPDWEKSIHFKTVKKSGGEVSSTLSNLLFVCVLAYIVLQLVKSHFGFGE